MKARLHDLSLARDGGYLLTIATRENVGALYDELHETDVDVTVKKHREKRSLDANAYAWVLMDKLAEATGTPTSVVYRQAVKDVVNYFYSDIIDDYLSTYLPEQIKVGQVNTTPNYPTDIPYADMSNNTPNVKAELLAKWTH